MSNIRKRKKKEKHSRQFKLKIQINSDKAFYCLLTEYIKSSVSLLEICLFQGKIGSTDQHMLQKLNFFFWSGYLLVQRGSFIAGDSKDPRTFKHIRSGTQPASWLQATLMGRVTNTDYPQTCAQFIPGLKLISLETLQGFKGRCSAGETHSAGMVKFHNGWKPENNLVPWCLTTSSQLSPTACHTTVTSYWAGPVQEQHSFGLRILLH